MCGNDGQLPTLCMTYHLSAPAAVPAGYTSARLSKFVRRFNVVSDVAIREFIWEGILFI